MGEHACMSLDVCVCVCLCVCQLHSNHKQMVDYRMSVDDQRVAR